jgi:hypothetical protein
VAGLLKKLFGREPKNELHPSFDGGRPSRKRGPQLGNIVVAQTAVDCLSSDPGPLIRAVVDFVNRMVGESCFEFDELPESAMQAYHVDYYLGQVNNGGHSQFVHNSHLNADTLGNIERGLEAMGADNFLRIFRSMTTWAAEHPEEAQQQTGYGEGRAAALDTLDGEFSKFDEQTPLEHLCGRWIASLPVLRPVSSSNLDQTMQAAAHLNPALGARRIRNQLSSISHKLHDPIHQGLGMAALSCSPAEMIQTVGVGMHEKIDGVAHRVWTCRTEGGLRGGVFGDQGVDFYEYISFGPASNTDTPTFEQIRAFRPPELSRKLSSVSRSDLERAEKFCKRNDVAAALSLLLRAFDPLLKPTYVALHGEIEPHAEQGEVAGFIISCFPQTLMAIVTDKGAVLRTEPDFEVALQVTREQIEEHAQYRDA